MFERFTDHARRTLVHAQEECRLLGHTYIRPAHLLLGLLHLTEGPTAATLVARGYELIAVRERFAAREPPAEAMLTGSLPFSPEAKQTLEVALRESLQLGQHEVGAEHLLLALLRRDGDPAAELLEATLADLVAMRAELVERLRAKPPPSESSATASEGPTCRRCRAPLTDHLRRRGATARGDLGAPDQPLAVIYCDRCGEVVALAPDDPPPEVADNA